MPKQLAHPKHRQDIGNILDDLESLRIKLHGILREEPSPSPREDIQTAINLIARAYNELGNVL